MLRGVLPDEVLVVAEIAAPAAAVRAIGEALGRVPDALPPEALAPLAVALTALQVGLSGSLAEFAERLAGGGAVVGLLPAANTVVTLAVTRPPSLAAALAFCARHPDRVHAAAAGELLLVSSTAAGLDLLRARAAVPAGRWAGVDFGERLVNGQNRWLRGVVDLAGVRRLLGDGAPQVERLDGGGRFLLAPFVHALAAAPWLRFGLAAGTRLVLDAEAEASVRGTKFGELLATPGEAPSLPPLPDDGLLFVSLDRCVGSLFRNLERLLPPADVLAAQGFLSIADALDGTRSSFVEDLLGGLAEPFGFYVVPCKHELDGASPPLVLPGFALVAPMATAAVEGILFRFAQTFATIVNAERGQRGQSLFVLRTLREERGKGLVAEPTPWRGPGRPPRVVA